MRWTLHTGDALETLRGLEATSFDAVLCDPPYGIAFMGKAWDHGVPSADVWAEVLRVLKPGAFCLAFGGTRTFHRLTCALEDAGFEIRDCAMWLYGSGFPKSHNFGRTVQGFDGYGTALKPAWEPCIVAMKPCDGTFSENAIKHGVAGMNIEAGRLEALDGYTENRVTQGINTSQTSYDPRRERRTFEPGTGRWPANLILDADAGVMLDASASAEQPSRFFYTAKASRGERDAGLGEFDPRQCGKWNSGGIQARREESGQGIGRNHHPCLKPLDLNRYLASLILPPKRDTPRRLLVPFAGSGSEMIGGLMAGWDEAVGIEREAEYVAIAEARLRHWTGAGAREALKDAPSSAETGAATPALFAPEDLAS